MSWCLGGKKSVLRQPRPKVSQNIILINTTKTLTHKDAKHSFLKFFFCVLVFLVSWCLGGKNSVLRQPHPKVSQNIILINTTKTQRHKAFFFKVFFLVSLCLGGKNSVLKQPRPKVSQNIILINTTKTQRHKAIFFKVFSLCLGVLVVKIVF